LQNKKAKIKINHKQKIKNVKITLTTQNIKLLQQPKNQSPTIQNKNKYK